MDIATDAADKIRLRVDISTAAEQHTSTCERKQFAFVARMLGKRFRRYICKSYTSAGTIQLMQAT